MSAKSGNSRNKIDVKHLCVYALLCATCMVLSYLEALVPTGFLKLGLSNSVALLLVCRGDTKGAFSVNISRILLSALLFGGAVSLAFSLSAGVVSLAVTALIFKFNTFSAVGLSVIGGVTHNIVQLLVAFLLLGGGVVLYFPLLLIGGVVSGALIGILCGIILKKIETKAEK